MQNVEDLFFRNLVTTLPTGGFSKEVYVYYDYRNDDVKEAHINYLQKYSLTLEEKITELSEFINGLDFEDEQN